VDNLEADNNTNLNLNSARLNNSDKYDKSAGDYPQNIQHRRSLCASNMFIATSQGGYIYCRFLHYSAAWETLDSNPVLQDFILEPI
jgi:hypothetical protein